MSVSLTDIMDLIGKDDHRKVFAIRIPRKLYLEIAKQGIMASYGKYDFIYGYVVQWTNSDIQMTVIREEF
jgi:hypothetical protein